MSRKILGALVALTMLAAGPVSADDQFNGLRITDRFKQRTMKHAIWISDADSIPIGEVLNLDTDLWNGTNRILIRMLREHDYVLTVLYSSGYVTGVAPVGYPERNCKGIPVLLDRLTTGFPLVELTTGVAYSGAVIRKAGDYAPQLVVSISSPPNAIAQCTNLTEPTTMAGAPVEVGELVRFTPPFELHY